MRAVFPTVLVVVFLICSISPVGAQISTMEAPAAPRTSAPPGPAAPRSNNPFLGGVPTGELTRDALSLSITDAINRALAYNLGVLLAENGVSHAQGARKRALSEMLPNITGRVSESRQMVNLAAFGFPLPAGIPTIVGRSTSSTRASPCPSRVLDLKAINDARGGSAQLAGRPTTTYKSARDLVVLVSATVSTAQALAASARVDAAQAQLDTAQALYNQAVDLKQNGAGRRHRRAAGGSAARRPTSQRCDGRQERLRESQAAARARDRPAARPDVHAGRSTSPMCRFPT